MTYPRREVGHNWTNIPLISELDGRLVGPDSRPLAQQLDELAGQVIPILRAGDPKPFVLLRWNPLLAAHLAGHLQGQGRHLEAEIRRGDDPGRKLLP